MYKSDDIKKLLGQRIKELRKIKGLTQEQLAEKMEIDQRNLSKIECGKSNPTPETIEKIIEVLNINPYLLYMSDEDINIDEVHQNMINILDKLKQNKSLYRKAYDFILELSQGL